MDYDGTVDQFFVTELKPAEFSGFKDIFKVFLVQVKSDSDTGARLLNDPISVFRGIKEMGIGDDPEVRAQVLRVNAEISANPVRRSAVVLVIPGSKTVVSVEYKYKE